MVELLAAALGALLARLAWFVIGPITQQMFTLSLPIDAAMELMV